MIAPLITEYLVRWADGRDSKFDLWPQTFSSHYICAGQDIVHKRLSPLSLPSTQSPVQCFLAQLLVLAIKACYLQLCHRIVCAAHMPLKIVLAREQDILC